MLQVMPSRVYAQCCAIVWSMNLHCVVCYILPGDVMMRYEMGWINWWSWLDAFDYLSCHGVYDVAYRTLLCYVLLCTCSRYAMPRCLTIVNENNSMYARDACMQSTRPTKSVQNTYVFTHKLHTRYSSNNNTEGDITSRMHTKEGQCDFCLKCGGFKVFRVCGFDRRPSAADWNHRA